MRLAQILSQCCHNKSGAVVLEIGDKGNRINQMITADAIVRNDEVVGSIPTSSTKLPRYLISFIFLDRPPQL
jgi:hypothetical protein